MVRRPVNTRQRGIALVIGLIMLLLLTLIGVNVIQSSIMEERMAGGTRDLNVAFQAAEAALRDTEQLIAGFCERPNPATTANIWNADDPPPADPKSDAWWNNANSYSDTLGEVAEQPRYIIEEVEYDSDFNFSIYRITARGKGGSDSARSILQSYYRKWFDQAIVIEGTPGTDVVTLVENASLSLSLNSNIIDTDISPGGVIADNPDCMNPDDDGLSLLFLGNGATDTFVLINALDSSSLLSGLGVDGLLSELGISDVGVSDLTSSLDEILDEFTSFKFKKVLIENTDSMMVSIANLGFLGGSSFNQDNLYCIDSQQIEGNSSISDLLLGDFLTAFLGLPVLGATSPVLDLADGVILSPLIGPQGILPVLSADGAVIADIGGDDKYYIRTESNLSALVMADLFDGSNGDEYQVSVSNENVLGLPNTVIVDIGSQSNEYGYKDSVKPHVIALGVPTDLLDPVEQIIKSKSLLDVGDIGAILSGLVSITSVLTNLLGSTTCILLGIGCPSYSDMFFSDLQLSNGINSLADSLITSPDNGVISGLLSSIESDACGSSNDCKILGNMLNTLESIFQSPPGTGSPTASMQETFCNPTSKRLSWQEIY